MNVRRLKHRWSLAHNPLAGLTAGCWWRLLRENQFAIAPLYAHRAAFITLASLLNSLYAAREQRRFGDAIAGTSLAAPPLFILGHWRSGTTHLHNLLALDDQFAFPNTYQVINPATFLSTEAFSARAFRGFLPRQRPMDNMALGFDLPQEDEFALLLQTLISPYLGVSFPRRQDHYEAHLTLERLAPEQRTEWGETFQWFARKLTLKYQRPLLFKSPPHTARIRLLVDLFPGARFVHIHRHPATVFQSFQHYFDTAAWYSYLQEPPDQTAVAWRIVRRYRAIYDAFFAQRPAIPAANFFETSFAALESDPIAVLGCLYESLRLPGFAGVLPKLKAYLASLRGYQKNKFAELSPDWRQCLAQEWSRCFEEWAYPV